jgi:hypothetical protein
MEQKELTTWREETALERFQLISPLLDSSLDRDKKIQLRKDLALQNNLSVKTLRRYERSFLEKGFAGLKPAECFLQEQNPKSCKEKYRELHCIFHTVTAAGLVTF